MAVSLRSGFDRVAPLYDWLEILCAGSCMQRCRMALAGAVQPAPGRVLVLGEGPGRFLAAALLLWPDAVFTVVEASGKMIARARRRVGDAGGRVQFVQADAVAWDAAGAVFDVVVTNFFLDCFSEEVLPGLIQKLSEYLAEGGGWLIADFAVPERGPARWRARVIVGMLYGFFRVTARLEARQLVQTDAFLAAGGLSLVTRESREWGLLRSELWRKEAAE